MTRQSSIEIKTVRCSVSLSYLSLYLRVTNTIQPNQSPRIKILFFLLSLCLSSFLPLSLFLLMTQPYIVTHHHYIDAMIERHQQTKHTTSTQKNKNSAQLKGRVNCTNIYTNQPTIATEEMGLIESDSRSSSYVSHVQLKTNRQMGSIILHGIFACVLRNACIGKYGSVVSSYISSA